MRLHFILSATVIIIGLLFKTTESIAQNLVPNPGFEEFFTCPQTINVNKTNSKIAPHWHSPSYGTPDLYNSCSKQMGIQNVTGFTNPFSGNGFAGIIVWEKQYGYREYLQVRLKEPLKAGATYIVSFRYKLSSYSKYSADRIAFTLDDTCTFYKHDATIPIENTFCRIKPKALDPNSGTWELLETEYSAKGNERYLTIGNFHNNINTKTTNLTYIETQEPMLEYGAYYYIDEVIVTEKIQAPDAIQDKPVTLTNKKLTLSDSYILENVLFDYDSDKLLESSFTELNEIVKILNSYPSWKIKIDGHTDNAGSLSYNQDLSERRVFSVKKYLMKNGILEERILSKGYGKSKPLTTKTDKKSQEKNRRVEVQFYE